MSPRQAGVMRRSRGAVRLLFRLAWRDMRSHPLGPLLLGIAVAVAAASLTLVFTLGPAANAPWDDTWQAAGSPHVVIVAAPSTDIDGALSDPQVAEVAGPFPLFYDDVTAGRYELSVQVVGRDVEPTAVDQPVVTHGAWVRPGGIVVEGSLAEALGLQVGGIARVSGRNFTVVGIAASGAQKPIAFSEPGLMWATRGDVDAMIDAGHDGFRTASLRLSDPADARAFAATWDSAVYDEWPPTEDDAFRSVTGWEEIRYDSLTDINFARAGLITGALAISLLTVGSAAIHLTSLLEMQARRMGLLEAIGATPRLAATLAVAEQLAITLPAAAIGLAAGWLASPRLARPDGAYLLEGTHLPAIAPTAVAVVLTATVALTALPALRPARRAARTSTMQMLTQPAHPPRRSARAISFSRRLPASALLGIRLASRRPGRALLAALGMGVSVAMIFVALAMEQGIAGDAARQEAGEFGVTIAYDKLQLVVYVFTITLIVLAAVNAMLIAWATAVDSAVPNALARAVGATPRQVGAGVALAQTIPAVLAAAIGIPFGLAIYLAAQTAGGADAATGPGWFLIVAVPAILVLTIALTLVPTQLAARQPVADALRGDE